MISSSYQEYGQEIQFGAPDWFLDRGTHGLVTRLRSCINLGYIGDFFVYVYMYM